MRRRFAPWALIAGALWLGASLRAASPGPDAAPAADTAYRLPAWPHGGGSPDFRLTDVDGHGRTLADYHGRVVVLFFGFVRCPDACPAALYKLALVMKDLGAERTRVQVLFVTLDPQRDTPDVLRGYVRGFDPSFVALTGTVADVDAAAQRFFVQYARVRQGADYTIDHSAGLAVVDAGGRLRLLARGDASVPDLVHDLTLLAREPAGDSASAAAAR